MMNNAKPTIDVRTFQTWCRKHASLARAVVSARESAKAERSRVDAYLQPVLMDARLTDDDGAQITDLRHVFLCRDEERTTAFFEACDQMHRAHGFTGPDGHCPALIAEHAAILAERALIDAAAPLFGIESWQLHSAGNDRERFLDLMIGACNQ